MSTNRKTTRDKRTPNSDYKRAVNHVIDGLIQIWKLGSKYKIFVYRPPRKRFNQAFLVPTVNHSGENIMVREYFADIRTDNLLNISGKMRKEEYLDILQNSTLPAGSRIIDQPISLQQDNDLRRIAKVCWAVFERKKSDWWNFANELASSKSRPQLNEIRWTEEWMHDIYRMPNTFIILTGSSATI